MLWSVIIDILIALVVILFWSVLLPLSPPRSSYLLDESQKAVHLSLRCCPAQPSGWGTGGAWTADTEPQPGRLPFQPPLCPRQHSDFSRGKGTNASDKDLSGQEFLLCLVNCEMCNLKRKSKMIRKTKRKNKQWSSRPQASSKQNTTKFNKRFAQVRGVPALEFYYPTAPSGAGA